jgi:hypothetical protein
VEVSLLLCIQDVVGAEVGLNIDEKQGQASHNPRSQSHDGPHKFQTTFIITKTVTDYYYRQKKINIMQEQARHY